MIGLCIKYYHENYGGMLQAFATTKYFEKNKYEYEIIRYEKNKNIIFKLKSIPRLFNSILLNDKIEEFKKQQGLKQNEEYRRNYKIRMDAFKRFKEKNFTNLSPVIKEYNDLCNLSKKYEIVISGSDQLWSPAGLPTNFYNLMFVSDDVKKISYASSFGVSNIPWYQINRTRNYLKRINNISVRENRGKEIVEELIGVKVPVVIDPVFLLTKEEWNKYIKPHKILNEKYVFAYFLGDNKEYRKKVEQYAKDNNLKIVTLRHLDKYVPSDEKFGDYAPYDISPADFLNLIRYADYVFTDSFHGTAFSIIFNKQFIVFNRYSNNSRISKNSRIDSICENLKLQKRRYDSEKFEKQVNETINYDEVNRKKDLLIEKSESYFKDALK